MTLTRHLVRMRTDGFGRSKIKPAGQHLRELPGGFLFHLRILSVTAPAVGLRPLRLDGISGTMTLGGSRVLACNQNAKNNGPADVHHLPGRLLH
jgi:hypothetical protein